MRTWKAFSPTVVAASTLLACTVSYTSFGQQYDAALHPRDAAIHDADTRAWWHTTEALSGDDMEGRDIGTEAYQRSADYVAARFKNAGLAPAGDGQSYFQSVPMHEVAVEPQGTSFTVEREKGGALPLDFLQQITITPAANLPEETEAALTFRGYCGKEAMQEVAGPRGSSISTIRTLRSSRHGGRRRMRGAWRWIRRLRLRVLRCC
jgi:hypothetical protein